MADRLSSVRDVAIRRAEFEPRERTPNARMSAIVAINRFQAPCHASRGARADQELSGTRVGS